MTIELHPPASFIETDRPDGTVRVYGTLAIRVGRILGVPVWRTERCAERTVADLRAVGFALPAGMTEAEAVRQWLASPVDSNGWTMPEGPLLVAQYGASAIYVEVKRELLENHGELHTLLTALHNPGPATPTTD